MRAHQRGFTVIEVVVSLALVAIALTGISKGALWLSSQADTLEGFDNTQSTLRIATNMFRKWYSNQPSTSVLSRSDCDVTNTWCRTIQFDTRNVAGAIERVTITTVCDSEGVAAQKLSAYQSLASERRVGAEFFGTTECLVPKVHVSRNGTLWKTFPPAGTAKGTPFAMAASTVAVGADVQMMLGAAYLIGDKVSRIETSIIFNPQSYLYGGDVYGRGQKISVSY